MHIVLASKNSGKIQELTDFLAPLGITVTGMHRLGIDQVPEDGDTFLANARQKALHCAEKVQGWVLAEDSGLEVDALGGRPGVYSSRYAGENATDDDNNKKLLAELVDVPLSQRTAQFRCVMVLANSGFQTWTAQGTCRGRISVSPRGDQGFGYDPLFIPSGSDKTFAEMSAMEKGQWSHRGKALATLQQILQQLIEQDSS